MDDHHEPEEHGAGDYHADHRFSSCVIAGSFGAPATVMARMTDEDLEAFAIDANATSMRDMPGSCGPSRRSTGGGRLSEPTC